MRYTGKKLDTVFGHDEKLDMTKKTASHI